MAIRNPIALRRQRRLRSELAGKVNLVEQYLDSRPSSSSRNRPIVFFNASTRIHSLSLNAAFSLLASWTVRAAGHDVQYWKCQAGLHPCVLGTDRRSPMRRPPCDVCIRLSDSLFPSRWSVPLEPEMATERDVRQWSRLPLDELIGWQVDSIPFGKLTLPSVRWVLRRHHLEDTPEVRLLYASYLSSGVNLASLLRRLLGEVRPKALVVFNGIFYPEAVARALADEAGVPVVTHEVGLRPGSAFFSHGEATFRAVQVPEGFRLSQEQHSQLDDFLSRRFRGDFTMAGIRFWPTMEPLPPQLRDKARAFRQQVSVFPNVIFDTSQIHANVIFEDMFAWLDDLGEIIRQEPDTLFVIRAHPDELRPGKESQETVGSWFSDSGLARLENAIFIGPDEGVSSYELARASKFVLFYNSSIGLEATILGVPALCAGRGRFTDSETAFIPRTRAEYRDRMRAFLGAASLEVPESQVENARNFLYLEQFHASLDLSEFLVADPSQPGMVRFSDFAPPRVDESETCQVIREGIVNGAPFMIPFRTSGSIPSVWDRRARTAPIHDRGDE